MAIPRKRLPDNDLERQAPGASRQTIVVSTLPDRWMGARRADAAPAVGVCLYRIKRYAITWRIDASGPGCWTRTRVFGGLDPIRPLAPAAVPAGPRDPSDYGAIAERF